MKTKIVPFFPKWWPWAAMALVDVILVKKGRELSEQELQHEQIHLHQQRELWYVGFFLIYPLEFFLRLVSNLSWMRAYKRISFEQEAFGLQRIVWEELETFRPPFMWTEFLIKDLRKLLMNEWWPYACFLLMSLYIYNDQLHRYEPELLPEDQRIFSNPGKAAEPAPPLVTVNLEDLYAAYESNEVRADQEYKGKYFYVIGRVLDISSTIFDEGMLHLYSEDQAEALAYFDKENKRPLAELSKGQRVSLECRCDGKGYMLYLRDCKLHVAYLN